MSRRRKRQPTAEEQALWKAVVKDATPLRHDAVRLEEELSSETITVVSEGPNGESPSVGPSPVDRFKVPLVRPSDSSALPSITVRRALPGLTPGDMTGMDRRTADRFRRGRMDIQGRIDLHGMSQAEAHGALTGFIRASSVQGKRCVIVITGKGVRGEGVLRRAVPHWLGDPALRPLIVSYTHAQPQHGGSGAYYVLLRRRRD